MGILVNARMTVHRFVSNRTVVKSGSVYEEVYCSKCKIQGVRQKMSDYIEVLSTGSSEAFVFCDGGYRQPVHVKVIECEECSTNPSYANIQPDTVHRTVRPPNRCTLDSEGVWVLGADEVPIKLVRGEYVQYKEKFEQFLNTKGL